mmetsp:Transcript_36252/g.87485  ORF Transcript_36252/g.87485 Transcript_36252/m.87485 type:complete len:503 (-) Transcript_36252:335-1843(-)
MTARQIISFIFLVLFPLFEAACYAHLHWQRNDLLIRKRNKSAIYVASLAGWLAYFNIVVSLFGGIPCGAFYVASLLVAPISVGPQIVRALALRGTIKYSQLVIEDEISSREQLRNKPGCQLPAIPSDDEGGHQTLPALVASSAKKIEANDIMAETKRIVKMTKLVLLVIPTIFVILALALSSSTSQSQMVATDFGQCQPEPAYFQYTGLAFGIMSVGLTLVGTLLVKQIDDELSIADEIRRNSVLLGCTHVVIIVVRLAGHSDWQPLVQTVQQMVLSYSMAIVPFLPPELTLTHVASWAKQQGKRINPATKSAVPGYARPLPKARMTSTRTSIQNVMGRRGSLSDLQNDHRHREMSVSWDAGLCVLLSTEDGINSFSQHCAREFSSENVRFWCAVNDFRAMFDEEKCTPASTKDNDETSASTAHTSAEVTVAKGICRLFIDPHSKSQVNLSSKQRSDIKNAIDKGELKRATFDAAQREIFSVMSRDSYPRFLASKKNRLQMM